MRETRDVLTWNDHQACFCQSDEKLEFQRLLPFVLERGVEFEVDSNLRTDREH